MFNLALMLILVFSLFTYGIRFCRRFIRVLQLAAFEKALVEASEEPGCGGFLSRGNAIKVSSREQLVPDILPSG